MKIRTITGNISVKTPEGSLLFPAVLLLSIFFLSPQLSGMAEAVPAFSKKYHAPCTVCHSSWPRLNKVGNKFAMNGFQMPDVQDGGTTGKYSPAWNLHLDSGDANPPLDVRFKGGLYLSQPASDADGAKSRTSACCNKDPEVGLGMAGTVRANVAYRLNYDLGNSGLQEGYVRFVNSFGPGKAGLDLGTFNTSDFDLTPRTRSWFAKADAAYAGNQSFAGREQGFGPGHYDTGFRLFGNPDFGSFSYELTKVTGANSTDEPYRGNGHASSAMVRYEGEAFGISIRYWESVSSSLTFKAEDGNTRAVYYFDGTGTLGTNIHNRDEKTSDVVVNLKYEQPRWQVEFVYDQNRFSVGERSDGTGSFNRDAVTRTGISLAGIYRSSGNITLGMRYAQSNRGGYNETLYGTTRSHGAAGVSRLDLQADFSPAQNARLSLGLSFDMSNENARKRVNSSGRIENYDQQNEIVLLWDWAI